MNYKSAQLLPPAIPMRVPSVAVKRFNPNKIPPPSPARLSLPTNEHILPLWKRASPACGQTNRTSAYIILCRCGCLWLYLRGRVLAAAHLEIFRMWRSGSCVVWMNIFVSVPHSRSWICPMSFSMSAEIHTKGLTKKKRYQERFAKDLRGAHELRLSSLFATRVRT